MNETQQRPSGHANNGRQRQTLALAFVVLSAFAAVIALSRWMDGHRPAADSQMEEERLYLTGNTLKRMSLGFNGLVADWYWMRSLQYVGRKILNNPGEIEIDNLKPLDMRLLYPLLDTATTLDPQFLVAYKYGAVVLPAISEEQAIKLIKKGMEQNPDDWRLYQHLGYIYWKRGDYRLASEAYSDGAKKPGALAWMQQMSARMAAEGGSHATAREIYLRLYEQTDDPKVKDLMTRRLMQVDSLEERDAISVAFKNFQQRNNRCPNTWREVTAELRAARLPNGKPLRLDASGVPLDPADAPYVLKNGCEVMLDNASKVPAQ
jgi:tetratricopeptide (TPR) repeat protein